MFVFGTVMPEHIYFLIIFSCLSMTLFQTQVRFLLTAFLDIIKDYAALHFDRNQRQLYM